MSRIGTQSELRTGLRRPEFTVTERPRPGYNIQILRAVGGKVACRGPTNDPNHRPNPREIQYLVTIRIPSPGYKAVRDINRNLPRSYGKI